MFEDSLIESGNRFKTKRRLSTTILSFVLQMLLIGVLILIPLIYTDALPKQQLMTFLSRPSTASAASATSARGRSCESRQNSERNGQRPIAHADEDSTKDPDD